jgi:hypothetical protein
MTTGTAAGGFSFKVTSTHNIEGSRRRHVAIFHFTKKKKKKKTCI